MELKSLNVGTVFALYTSYCGAERCSDSDPCTICRDASNKFRVDAIASNGVAMFGTHLASNIGGVFNTTISYVIVDNKADFKRYAPYSTMIDEITVLVE